MTDCGGCGGACGHALCVHKVPVFASLGGEDLARIAAMIRHQAVPKGGALFHEGDPLHALTIIRQGAVKAYRITPDGREQILYLFSAGDFFGERSLFGAHAAPYTVEALEPAQTCSFTRDSFRALLYDHPDIAVKIIEELENRIERMENALKRIGVRSVDERIGALLADFADRYGTAVPEGVLIRLPLSREGMASQLGIARETMSRKLGQLESDGVIRSVSNKSILLLNRGALVADA